jgi:hypothetical protein
MPAHLAKRVTKDWLASLALQERRERGYISLTVLQFYLYFYITFRATQDWPESEERQVQGYVILKCVLNKVKSLI